jgi:rhodanese-related sulfurtransferase
VPPTDLEITTADAARALEEGAQVVDVREPYERAAGHIPGSRHIELTDLAAQAATLDPAVPVVTVCRVGARSHLAAQALRGAGFDATSMAGGMLQWAHEDRPLEPASGHVADH